MYKILNIFLFFCLILRPSWGSTRIWMEETVTPLFKEALSGARPLESARVAIFDETIPGYTGTMQITYSSGGPVVVRPRTKHLLSYCGEDMNYADIIHQVCTTREKATFSLFGLSKDTVSPKMSNILGGSTFSGAQDIEHHTIFVGNRIRPFFPYLRNTVSLVAPGWSVNNNLCYAGDVMINCPTVINKSEPYSAERKYGDGPALCFLAMQPRMMITSCSRLEYPVCFVHGNISYNEANLYVTNVERLAVFTLLDIGTYGVS